MRPTKLVLSAFGPYASVTTIDFDALGTAGVYLVCGDTGSGKTVIFDAICFALFGETSGDAKGGARTAESLRSDYVGPSDKTYVELEFEYREAHYRVKRNPQYERLKKSGKGMTKEPASAEMDLPDGTHVEGKQHVDACVRDLLGIDASQFKQIVMLAQGEFRKLLVASTAEREIIFRNLFGTERYELLQKRLKEERDRLAAEHDKAKSRLQDIARDARFPEGSTSRAELDQKLTEPGQLGAWLEEALKARLAEDVPIQESVEAQVEELRHSWFEAHLVLEQAKKRPQIAQDVRVLEAELAAARERTPQLVAVLEEQRELDGERSRMTERAAVIERSFEKYEELQAARESLERARGSLEQARAAFDAISKDREQTSANAKRLQAETAELGGADLRFVQAQHAHDDAAKRLEMATKAKEQAAELAEKEQLAALCAESLRVGKERLEETTDLEAHARESANAARTACEKLHSAPTALAEANAACEKATQQLETARQALNERERLVKLVEDAQAPYRDASKRFAAAQAQHDADYSLLHDLQRRQRAGRAGLLAAELEDGAPCPVCGSIHHPNPASSEDAIPSDAEVDAASARELASGKEANDLSQQAAQLKTALEARRSALAEFDAGHGGLEGVGESLVHAQEALGEAEAAKEAAEEMRRQEVAARAALEKAQKGHEEAQGGLQVAQQAVRDAEIALAQAEKAVEVARGFGAVDSLQADAAYASALEAMGRVEQGLAEARAQAEKLGARQDELEQCLVREQEVQKRFDAAHDDMLCKELAVTTAEELAAHLERDLEFSSIRQARAQAEHLRCEALRLQEEREKAEAAVRENAHALDTQEQLLAAKRKQLAELPDDDISELSASLDEYQARGDALNKKAEAVKERIVSNRGCLDRVAKALATAEDIEKRYGRVKMLADVANGNLPGPAKIRFESYVQAIYFDKIIAAANRRLKLLASGQLELLRYSEGAGNAKAGLGLYVLDASTGRARAAASLSGGESFQASLCLALGLSDIVQAHAGGIEFGSMFVDEGFGSLDQEALGNSISLLSELSGGDKLIGIISHVEDLKANIPKKIVVTKGRAGSSATVEL